LGCVGALAALLALAAASGCATAPTASQDDANPRHERRRMNYFKARWLDFADIWVGGWGWSYGAMAKVTVPGDVTLGVGATRAHHYRWADRYYEWREDWHVGMPGSFIFPTSNMGDCLWRGWETSTYFRSHIPWGVTTHAWKSARTEIIKAYPIPSEKWADIAAYGSLHVVASVIGHIEFGINFVEMFDFLTGWVLIDPAGDDSMVVYKD
jgi:hypothetical protein